jgi:UDP-N-acetylglucosamine 3-dehydrogenase
MLRVAVIGMGGIGNIHARLYSQNKEARLVAVCDLLAERAEGAAQRFGVTAYRDAGEMLRAEEIDAVSVCTAGPENGGHHYEPVMTCLAASKHVLVEKPISNNIAHAREMVRYAKEQGVLLGVNLNHRFTAIADRSTKLIAEGALGEILFINMALWIDNPNESSPWFHLRALHPHSIDVMRTFGGPIARVQAFMHKGPGRSIWSNTSVNVQFASGAVGHLTGSYDASMLHPIERCEIGGSEGRIVVEDVTERLVFFPRRSVERLVIENTTMDRLGRFDDTFDNRINTFVAQVQAGGPLDASGDDGLAAQEVIEAAIRSWENGTIEEVQRG